MVDIVRKIYIRPAPPIEPKKDQPQKSFRQGGVGDLPRGWEVYRISYNREKTDPENLIALPTPIYRFILERRLRPPRAILEAIVAWWRDTHPITRKRTYRLKVVAMVKDCRRLDSEKNRKARVAAYLKKQD